MLAEVNRLHPELFARRSGWRFFRRTLMSDFERAAGLDADQLIGRSDGYRDYSHPREPNYVGRISHPAMFPDYLRLHLVGIDIEMLGQVNAEAQAVEEGAGA